MRFLRGVLCVGLVAALMFGCAPKKQAATTRLVLDWTPSTNHTGIYLAQALGYYEEAGITLEILQPPESGALPVVSAGQSEFGISFQEELGPALGLEQPLEVQAVAAIIQHNTSGILSPQDRGIARPRDLEGKRLAMWDTPLAAAVVQQLVEEDGGDFSKVQLEFNNVADVFMAYDSGIDAIWVYYAWDGVAAEVRGLATNFMPIATENPVFDYYTPILVVNSRFARENPEQVRKFVEATSRGYRYAIEHPEQAAKLFVEMVPELDYELVLASQLYLKDQYQADAPRWGEIAQPRWAAFNDWLWQQGLTGHPVGSAGYTNEFLPEG